jgi:hypothetical protein
MIMATSSLQSCIILMSFGPPILTRTTRSRSPSRQWSWLPPPFSPVSSSCHLDYLSWPEPPDHACPLGNDHGYLLPSVLYHPHVIWPTYSDQNHQTAPSLQAMISCLTNSSVTLLSGLPLSSSSNQHDRVSVQECFHYIVKVKPIWTLGSCLALSRLIGNVLLFWKYPMKTSVVDTWLLRGVHHLETKL